MPQEPGLTLIDLLQQRSSEAPDRPFVEVLEDRCETYAQVYEAARRLAAGLVSLGVARGEAAVVMVPNSLAAIHSWFAINMTGGIEVAINTAYRGPQLAHAIQAIAAKWIIIDGQFLSLLQQVEALVPTLECAIVIGNTEVTLDRVRTIPYAQLASSQPIDTPIAYKASDIASVIYTSGTTGPAKPVLLPHAANLHAAAQIVRGLRLTDSDVYYCAHPLFHMAGKSLAVIAQMLAGGKVVLDAKFNATNWIQRIHAAQATVTVAHGPMVEMIQAEPASPLDRATRLTRVLACPLPKRVAQEFEVRFGVLGLEAYGMTEVGIVAIRSMDESLRLGACGRIDVERYDVRIADPESDAPMPLGEVGQILVRPKKEWILMQGYSGMPEATLSAWRNLWFQTGDVGYVDADGYLNFVDRLGDRIRRRSENISSYDIEAVAMGYPGVMEVAAVGVASEFEADDDIKLSVATSNAQAIDCHQLLQYLVARLPHYMVPRYIEQVSRLPRTPTNKVRKKELRASGVTDATWDRKAHGVELRRMSSHV